MIDFEHGALRRNGEPVLAGTIAHAVMDHRDARAFSFLNGAAVLERYQWSIVIDAEVKRGRTYRPELERAVRRVRALLLDDADAWIHPVLSGLVNEIGWTIKREHPDVTQRTYSAISGMLTVTSLAVLYLEQIGEGHLALIYEPFEQFIPLASLA